MFINLQDNSRVRAVESYSINLAKIKGFSSFPSKFSILDVFNEDFNDKPRRCLQNPLNLNISFGRICIAFSSSRSLKR